MSVLGCKAISLTPRIGSRHNRRMDTLKFSRWTTWCERDQIVGRDCPGVYVLAKFAKKPPTNVNPRTDAVLYIGETCRQTLTQRWGQFDRSALEGKPGHSGGLTFHETLLGGDKRQRVSWLYVAALPITSDVAEPLRSALIRYEERRLIWEFAKKFGRLPPCNTK